MNDAIQAQNDPALILYKNNIQQLKIPYVQTSALIALILYKNNIQRKKNEGKDRANKALILYKNNIQR